MDSFLSLPYVFNLLIVAYAPYLVPNLITQNLSLKYVFGKPAF